EDTALHRAWRVLSLHPVAGCGGVHPIFMGWTKIERCRYGLIIARSLRSKPLQLPPKHPVLHLKHSSPERRRRRSVLGYSIAIALPTVCALAGDFTMSILTGDGDSGINSGLNYTAKA